MKARIKFIKIIFLLLALNAAFFLKPDALYPQNYSNDEAPKVDKIPARLSYVRGNVYLQRASDLGYEQAVVNTPLAEGDRIGTTEGRAEIQFERRKTIWVGEETKLDLEKLPDRSSPFFRLRLFAGTITLGVQRLDREQEVEVRTPDLQIFVLDEGRYRVTIQQGQETDVRVFAGLVEVRGQDRSQILKAGQLLRAKAGRLVSRAEKAGNIMDDDFDRWCADRLALLDKRSRRGVLPEDLDQFEAELEAYGDWIYLPPYGFVWVPRSITPDWRPYSFGRWIWIDLYGWTWLPYEPWGWVTFHYGRWHWSLGIGWYWIPMRAWGPGWVSWWWSGDYIAWAPLSYWGRPVVVIENIFYDRYSGSYPVASRALTVIHKDQLKAPNAAEVSLRPENLRGIQRIELSSSPPPLRPTGSIVGSEILQEKSLILKKQEASSGLKSTGTITGPALQERGENKASPASKDISIRLPEERRIRKPGQEAGSTDRAIRSPWFFLTPGKQRETILQRLTESLRQSRISGSSSPRPSGQKILTPERKISPPPPSKSAGSQRSGRVRKRG